jgi:putative NADH-flavin reductase
MTVPLTLAVFGAAGGTGRELVAQALSAGHRVRAVVRQRAAFSREHPLLTVHEADVLTKRDVLAELVTGADAVLSALGSHSGRQPTDVYSRGTRNICDAMLAARAARLLVVSALPVCPDSEKGFFERVVIHPLLHLFLRGVYDDVRRMESDLVATSAIEWTVFRPPRLVDGPATGKQRTTVGARLTGAGQIRRADLAAAMLATIGDRALIRKAVNIAS